MPAPTSMLIAITRDVSPSLSACQLTHVTRTPIDVGLAETTHLIKISSHQDLAIRLDHDGADCRFRKAALDLRTEGHVDLTFRGHSRQHVARQAVHGREITTHQDLAVLLNREAVNVPPHDIQVEGRLQAAVGLQSRQVRP